MSSATYASSVAFSREWRGWLMSLKRVGKVQSSGDGCLNHLGGGGRDKILAGKEGPRNLLYYLSFPSDTYVSCVPIYSHHALPTLECLHCSFPPRRAFSVLYFCHADLHCHLDGYKTGLALAMAKRQQKFVFLDYVHATRND